jgi:hypothetical protein
MHHDDGNLDGARRNLIFHIHLAYRDLAVRTEALVLSSDKEIPDFLQDEWWRIGGCRGPRHDRE